MWIIEVYAYINIYKYICPREMGVDNIGSLLKKIHIIQAKKEVSSVKHQSRTFLSVFCPLIYFFGIMGQIKSLRSGHKPATRWGG